jgi:hypothetical protein
LLEQLDLAVEAAIADTLETLWRLVLNERTGLTAGAGDPPVVDGRLDQTVRETWREAFTRWVRPFAYAAWNRQYQEAGTVGPEQPPEQARDQWWGQVLDRVDDTAGRMVEAVRDSVREAPTESIDALRDRVSRVLGMDAPAKQLRDEIAVVEAKLAGRQTPLDVRTGWFARRVAAQVRLFAGQAQQARARAQLALLELSPRNDQGVQRQEVQRAESLLNRGERTAEAARKQLTKVDAALYSGVELASNADRERLQARRRDLYAQARREDEGTWANTARRIARTTSTDVLNEATLQRGVDAEVASGEEMVKVWLSSRDERVRPSHRRTHGQTVPLAEKFAVGRGTEQLDGEEVVFAGVPMDRPADPEGPPEEVINCRCSIAILTRAEHEEIAAVLAAAQPPGGTMTVPVAEAELELSGLPPVMWHGVITVEDEYTGDRRKFNRGALRTQPLPMPIRFQREDWGGHTGAVVVANLEQTRRFGKQIRAWGTFADGALTPEVDEVQGLMATRMIRGVSIDGDDSVYAPEADAEGNIYEVYDQLRLRASTFVAIPAYDEAEVFLGPPPEEWLLEGESLAVEQQAPETSPVDLDALYADASAMPANLAAYWTRGEGAAKIAWGTPGDFNRCRQQLGEYVSPGQLSGTCANLHHRALGVWPGQEAAAEAITAAVQGVSFTAGDFAPRELDGPTPLTITDDGYVFGHVAAWGTCHTGFSGQCILPPKSKTNYALFHLSGIKLDDGSTLRVGKLTVGGGHADPKYGIRPATQHYDDSGFGAALVRAHEDTWGVQVAGRIIPGTPQEKIDELLRSPLSGDWRNYQGNLELIAALGVNVPGFPVIPKDAQALAAAGTPVVGVVDGVQVSLVAAGIVPRSAATLSERFLAAAARVATLRVAPDLREARAARAAARINPDEGGN